MKRFLLLMGIACATALALAGITWLRGDASEFVFGMPAVCVGSTEPCWISFGGVGVLVFGAGFGVIEIGLYGVGLLFATGQLAAGLIAVAQLGLGPIFFLGQVGGGLAGGGQLVLGLFTRAQVYTTEHAPAFLDELSADLNRLLTYSLRDT